MQNDIITDYSDCEQLLLNDKIKKIYSHVLSFGFEKKYLSCDDVIIKRGRSYELDDKERERAQEIIKKAYPKIYDSCYESNRDKFVIPKAIEIIYSKKRNDYGVIFKLLRNIILNEQDCPENKNISNEVFEIIKDSKIFGKYFYVYEKYAKMTKKEFLIEEENFKKNYKKIFKNNFDSNSIFNGVRKVIQNPNASGEEILEDTEKIIVNAPDLLDKENLRLFEYNLFEYCENLVHIYCVLNGYYDYIKNAETSVCEKCKMKIKLISTKYLYMICDVCGKTCAEESLGHYCIFCNWFKCEKCK
jgi:hypothetical protein